MTFAKEKGPRSGRVKKSDDQGLALAGTDCSLRTPRQVNEVAIVLTRWVMTLMMMVIERRTDTEISFAKV